MKKSGIWFLSLLGVGAALLVFVVLLSNRNAEAPTDAVMVSNTVAEKQSAALEASTTVPSSVYPGLKDSRTESRLLTNTRIDPAVEKYPKAAGYLRKLGPFEVVSAEVAPLRNGRVRVERVIRTDLKYPNIWVVEEYDESTGEAADKPTKQQIAAADHFLVQFRPEVGKAEIEYVIQENGFSVQRWFSKPGMVAVKTAEGHSGAVTFAIDAMLADPRVEVAEPDFMVFAN